MTGNRKSKTVGGTTYTNTIAGNSNRLNQTQDVNGTATILHDAAGHMTSDGTNTYTYNDRGRMTSATTPGGVVSYLYNGLNQRVGKNGPIALIPTGAAYFLYDEAGQLLGEYDANGSPVYETIYLGSMPVGVMKQTGSAANSDIAVSLYNVNADHIDTPRLITKQDQTIVWRWDTAEAFGGTAPNQNPSGLGVFVFNQRFPGQVADAETGLFQNWNREYNARLGRYVESDPIGLKGGINTFAYVSGNPLSFTDPLGLQAAAGAAGGLGGLGGAGGAAGAGGRPNASSTLIPWPKLLPDPVVDWILEMCASNSCPSCKTASGKVVPLGTIAYRPMDTPSTPQHGIVGPHYNLYRANQNPKNCQCFWQSIGAVPATGLPAGAIPIEPFAN